MFLKAFCITPLTLPTYSSCFASCCGDDDDVAPLLGGQLTTAPANADAEKAKSILTSPVFPHKKQKGNASRTPFGTHPDWVEFLLRGMAAAPL